MTKIKIDNLYKSFGQKQVLKGVNLEVEEGEIMVIIGQSGSGKSVLLKHIIGIMKPDAGEIYVDGQVMNAFTERELLKMSRKFGMLFQGSALFDSLTVEENVAFGLRRHTTLSDEEIKKVVRASLERVGLRDIEHLLPYELSGGMKKRVGLARAIAYGPEIILYDEPTTGLDPIRSDAINNLILQLKRDLNVTSIVITHDMNSTYKVADRIAMLYEGRIIEVGSTEEIRNSPNPIVQQFINGRATGPIAEW
ncbi:MAG TPA: ABC transporter ATP-binding protein [Candidatus Saccharicenans sp.]|nr:ABC transporter ATP-binding protein [Candidatus Saccharicenans sp.]HQO75265.1 ABC transporter ATP-binding protein [Candidatus Saccharicenans sp.]HUM78457.1 ABC transporter ATP-binding protein [Candidatus Saccharicenans sp.]